VYFLASPREIWYIVEAMPTPMTEFA